MVVNIDPVNFQAISYLEKISRLQDHFVYSTKLSEAIGVSRRTVLNWKNRPSSISATHQLEIDVLYCRIFLIPEWDHDQSFEPVLVPDKLLNSKHLFLPYLKALSFGTVEIETNITQQDFDRIIDEEKLPRNMDRRTFHEGFNAFVTNQRIWERIVGRHESMEITEEVIKSLHASFMQGVRDDSGLYSTRHRVMGRLEGVETTSPEDIPEEVNRWVYKVGKADTLDEIARAHAWFMLIHPFGDGNGRVGRALAMIQCLNAGLMPPLLDGGNRAIYYAAMEHAMRHGRHMPLIRLFHETSGSNRTPLPANNLV